MRGNSVGEPFQSEEFKELKDSLISKHEGTFLDFGRKKDFYLIFIDNHVSLINQKLEIELEFPLRLIHFESVGRISFQIKIGNDYYFRLLPEEKEIIEKYTDSCCDPFQTEQFTKLKHSLISKHKFTYLDFGVLNEDNRFEESYYFILIDNKGYLIGKEINTKPTSLQFVFSNHDYNKDLWTFQIGNLFSTFRTDKEQKQILTDYKDSLLKYESTFLQEIDHYKMLLLTNEKAKTLLTNFLDQHFKRSFKNGGLFEIYEDDALAALFYRDKKFDLGMTENFRGHLESYYQKLLKILFNWGILEREDIGENGFLVLNRSLRDIAIEYYTNGFEELYGGYFSFDELLDLDSYIDSYYTIDFLDHDEKDNIGYFTYFLFSKNKEFHILSDGSLFKADQILSGKIAEYEKNKELKSFEYSLMNSKKTQQKNGYINVTIDDVDLMSGVEFEEFIRYLFKKMGYTVNLTPASGDQGIDLVAVKNGLRIGIQTKCYSNSVSNKAIQEVVAGVNHYQLAKAIVITNNYFTKPAIELALSNDVVLWDRGILKEKIFELNR